MTAGFYAILKVTSTMSCKYMYQELTISCSLVDLIIDLGRSWLSTLTQTKSSLTELLTAL